jgi:hypothetical protein
MKMTASPVPQGGMTFRESSAQSHDEREQTDLAFVEQKKRLGLNPLTEK